MEIITLQMKRNKQQFVVITSDGENVELTPDAIVKYSITVGNIEDKIFETAVFESQCTFALNKSMKWLTASYRSEKEVIKYLKEKKYDNKVINYVLDKLKEYNFLNDENLANNFVEFGQNKMGIHKLRQKLMNKGVNKDIIENALKNVDNQDEICYDCAIKKIKNMDKTKENLAKLIRYLLSKGFDYDTIKRTCDKLKLNEGEENDWY